ncbi:MAG: Gfo/Idh/MocA family protein [Candidatus Hodarchaeota archaeon]
MAKKRNTKKVTITGFGGIGHSWLRAINRHPDFELIGIIDIDTEMLENVESFNIGLDEDQAYISIEHACQFGEKPDLNILGTPIPTHSGLAQETLDLGVNVICEKNMASSIPQAKQMVQKAMDHPELCTAVGTQYRYGGSYWTAKKFFELEDNPIGDLGLIRWEDYGYRGEKRWGWRRFLEEVYLEDMSVHWFDCMRYVTGMDIVQVKADTFMPRYNEWFGSSTVFANIALAKPEDYKDRHKWVWVHFAGDWATGINDSRQEFYGGKGFAKLGPFGVEYSVYKNPSNRNAGVEEDGYLGIDAGPMEGLNVPYTGQEMILEMMSRGIDSGGEKQPGTNFKEAFKSFAVSQACKESSFTGNTIWVPNYWKDFLD